MIPLLLCGLIAGACAAPHFKFGFQRPQRPLFTNYHYHPYVDDNVFDTSRSWSDVTHRFPKSVSREGIEGNEYKITISLPDFDKKDIVVKARTGLLAIQASQKYADGSEKNYSDVRTLPENVYGTGNWIFEAGVLRITFPLNGTPAKPIPRTVTPRIVGDGEATTYAVNPKDEVEFVQVRY